MATRVGKVKFTDKHPDAIAKLAAELGGFGAVHLGVQGKEAEEQHPKANMPVGALAGVHELGLGVPRRSWLLDWLTKNQAAMVAAAASAFQDVCERRKSRKEALTELGYGWTDALRKNISEGHVRPALSPVTIQKKGHSIPLLETATLVNAITYSLFLPHIKSIGNAGLREIARLGKKR